MGYKFLASRIRKSLTQGVIFLVHINCLFAGQSQCEESNRNYCPVYDYTVARYQWTETMNPNINEPENRKTPLTVTTRMKVMSTHPDEPQILLYNMDNGAKLEWFRRTEDDTGFQLHLLKAEGIDHEGIRRSFRVEPPVLMWKWPVSAGDVWENDQLLIIDNNQRIPTHSKVEVLDTDGAVILPGGCFRDVLVVRVTYDSHLGRDMSTFHIGNNIGMLREEQIVNDGRVLVTEFLSADYYTPLQAPTLTTSQSHPCDPFSLECDTAGIPENTDILVTASDTTHGRLFVWSSTELPGVSPELFMAPLEGTDSFSLRLEFVEHEKCTYVWTAVTIDDEQISPPSILMTTVGPCPGLQ